MSLILTQSQQIAIALCKLHIKQDANRELNELISKHEGLDWQALIDYCTSNGILPMLHQLILFKIEPIPEQIKKDLIQLNQFLINRNKNQSRELKRVQLYLRKGGIPVISYKGMPFASQFYGNIFQRTSVDIDFALGTQHFKAAREAMLQLGYEEIKAEIGDQVIHETRAYFLDYPFVYKKDGKILFNVEFHWTPNHYILNVPISFKEFQDDTTLVPVGQFKVVSFDKVHQALFAVIHHGTVDCWGKLKHLLDFALILKTLSTEEIEQLEKHCKKYKIYNSYEIGKAFLNMLLNEEISFKKKPSKRWIEDLVHGKLKGNWSENRYKFIYFLQSRDSFWEQLKSAYSIFKYQFFIKPKLDLIEDDHHS